MAKVARFSAWAMSPSRSSRRISGRLFLQSGFTLSRNPPDHTLSSLSWMRSATGPPNTIAPSLPLPRGRALFQSSAGL